jgi:phage-related protein
MSQYGYKEVLIEEHAKKDFDRLENSIKKSFDCIIGELSEIGFLEYPKGKKLRGTELFEIRVLNYGYWRAIYAYWNDKIVILNVFNKKSSKTPMQEIEKSMKRLKNL